jgi:hypothetical protein
MDKNELNALSEMLCADESNESNEVIVDLVRVSHGIIITDPSRKDYNGYLVGV